MVTKVQKVINGVTYSLETGRLANQATAAVLAQAGETVVMCVVSVGNENPDLDYFPLSVDYVEKLYAAGTISGSRFMKREGRPTDKEILAARLLDRGVRSLMPEDLTNEVQIIVQVMAYDHENDPELLQYIGASAALMLAGLPYKGPVAIVRSGMLDGQLVNNISLSQKERSQMNLMVSVTEDAIVSIEADADMVKEDILTTVLKNAVQNGKDYIDLQKEFVEKAGKKEFTYNPRVISEELTNLIMEETKPYIEELIFIKDKTERVKALKEKKVEFHQKHDETYKPSDIAKAWDDMIKHYVRKNAIENKRRIDGRAMDELRPISAEVGVLPRVHGSAIFNRGETQVLSIVTLGSARMEQTLEGIDGEQTKRLMHHYNFPGYSVGEVDRKFGMANRRAIGHGMIGEKSIEKVMPDPDKFKYTVRIVSEVMSSNGSTSMGSTCASILALMQAGVQIKAPVAGISVGLVYESPEKYALLTDILGDEDHYGDMDFKITGTKDGWTAIQLDNKLAGIPAEILIEAISQNTKTRMFILDYMNSVMSKPNDDLSQYAPRITTIKIAESKIGELIGPGGKVIKEIIAESGAEIDIEDDGSVNIAATSQESADKAVMLVKQALNDVETGSILDATIKRVESYGAFIEISKNFGGLVHVSQLGEGFIKNAADVVKVGQAVKVRYDGKDDQGRHNFSMKGVEQEVK